MDLTFPQSSLSDLSTLRCLSPTIAQFLVSEVCQFLAKRSQGNLDVLRLSREIENEGVEVSNDKIETVVRALKLVLFKVLKAGSQGGIENQSAVLGQLQTILSERCSFKEKMITAIVTQLQSEFQLLNDYQA